ncbi:Hypothetical predicted protein [Octopus vulgaris]|uniref:Integrase zinc-binding domain-containing protein n=1 Tax=Octopus vulgaris TaxID=6645 RepID=A0AA36AHV5_OCTVU|nr:Hypothetical predicted protein [Octopus vulgaris]
MSKDQVADKEFSLYKNSNSTSLKFKMLPIHSCNSHIWCDISTGFSRPFVPEKHRKNVFSSLHNLSHPGIEASLKLISSRFVWPGMNKDVRSWVKSCMQCQKSKVQRHIKAPLVVLLGIRTAVKENIQYSPAELLYGTTLTLPAQMFEETNSFNGDVNDYVTRLRRFLTDIPSFTRKLQNVKSFVSSDRNSWTHVFVRKDAAHNSLKNKYTGPFKVLSVRDKTMTLEMNGKKEIVSVDRVKKAYFDQHSCHENEDMSNTYQHNLKQSDIQRNKSNVNGKTKSILKLPTDVKKTRSGRIIFE